MKSLVLYGKQLQKRSHVLVAKPPIIRTFATITYRLDDGSRQLRDLECRGNRCKDVPSAEREGGYFSCQGALNPVVADDSSSKVFILQLHGNNKPTQMFSKNNG